MDRQEEKAAKMGLNYKIGVRNLQDILRDQEILDIEMLIFRAIRVFVSENVNQPTSIYLGNIEYMGIKAYSERFHYTHKPTTPGEFFNGLQIFRVCIDSHLHIA